MICLQIPPELQITEDVGDGDIDIQHHVEASDCKYILGEFYHIFNNYMNKLVTVTYVHGMVSQIKV